jgi:WD40 repeat protein
MQKEPQKTFHLYHHQPDPLTADAVGEQAWLVNNGANYSLVAIIQARTPEGAYQAVQEKMAGHGKLARFVTLRVGNLLRESLPGDVLVGEDAAWMIGREGQVERISYEESSSWKSYAHDSPVQCISWAPNGLHVAASSHVVALHSLFWEEGRHSTSPTYRRHGSSTSYAVAWSPDGNHIASGSYSEDVHVWTPGLFGGYSDAATGSILVCRTEEAEHWSKRITCIAWTPDSRSVLAGRSDGAIVHWDAVTGACLHLFERHSKEVNTLAYAPDKTRIASASDDGTLRIWDSEQAPFQDLICQHNGPVSAFAWSPDGTLLASASDNNQSLHFWDTQSGEPAERIPLSVSFTRLLNILTVTWSPDGRYIAAGCDDGTLQIVDMQRRRHILTYRIGSNGRKVRVAAWSPDGPYIATGGSKWGSSGGEVQIWRVELDEAPPLDEAVSASPDLV